MQIKRQLMTLVGAGALAWGITLCSDSSALAWFNICNRSSSDVRAAFAYNDMPDTRTYCGFTGCQPIPGKMWISSGWYYLRSGECKQVYPHELRKRNTYYYVYAEASDGSGEWTGNHPFCVLPDRENFSLGRANQVCNGERRNFIERYTGNSKNATFTFVD
jgi:uncharacterized membrane protein